MHSRNLWIVTLFIVLTALSFFLIDAHSAVQDGCLTCHAKILKGKDVHPATQSCESCHQSLGPHPQQGAKGFKLMQEPPELCALCHQPFGKKPNVHPPVKNGMCTSCHNPHSSNEAKLLLQPVKDLCLTCHGDKAGFKYMHGPASTGDCTTCHSPHESDNKALTVKKGVDLCATCHPDMQDAMKKKDVHPAILSGCTSCHNPHGSPYKKFLSAEGEKLCFQCHPQISEKVEKSSVVHGPIKTEKACASCHTPHSSDNEKLLLKTGKDLCLECHTNIIKKNMTVLHGPIASGTCTPCHNPHGSPYVKLLSKEFSADSYVPYTDKEYELCFSCHNRDLLRFPDTSFATGFRNGERNLHYLHVNKKDKGRNCILCHDVHGGSNPKLIATSVLFGKWELSMNFVKTETGGRCSPGCHKPQNYDRKTPGKAPEAEKPKEKGKEKETK